MRVKVDVDKCIGAGQCVAAAATVFAQGDADGLVVVLNERPSANDETRVRSAIRLCPARAIWLENDHQSAAAASSTK